jgi:hypothetical protein
VPSLTVGGQASGCFTVLVTHMQALLSTCSVIGMTTAKHAGEVGEALPCTAVHHDTRTHRGWWHRQH